MLGGGNLTQTTPHKVTEDAGSWVQLACQASLTATGSAEIQGDSGRTRKIMTSIGADWVSYVIGQQRQKNQRPTSYTLAPIYVTALAMRTSTKLTSIYKALVLPI